MIAAQDAALLETAIRREARSLLQYLSEAYPWTKTGGDATTDRVRELAREERDVEQPPRPSRHQRGAQQPRPCQPGEVAERRGLEGDGSQALVPGLDQLEVHRVVPGLHLAVGAGVPTGVGV